MPKFQCERILPRETIVFPLTSNKQREHSYGGQKETARMKIFLNLIIQ